MFVLSCLDAGGLSSTATVKVVLEETNDFPPMLHPSSGYICRGVSSSRYGLFLTAVDEDRHPHAAPFIFELVFDQSANWTVVKVNGKDKNLVVGIYQKQKYSFKNNTVSMLFLGSFFSRHTCFASAHRRTGGGRVCSQSGGERLRQSAHEC